MVAYLRVLPLRPAETQDSHGPVDKKALHEEVDQYPGRSIDPVSLDIVFIDVDMSWG